MSLNPTQRQFILNRLGIQPRHTSKARVMTGRDFDNREVEKALDEYLQVETEVMADLKELKGMPSTGVLCAPVERDLGQAQRQVKDARRDSAKDKIREATANLKQTQKGLKDSFTVARNHQSFFAQLEQTGQDMQALRAHAQSAHVPAQIKTAGDELDIARAKALEFDIEMARRSWRVANAACQDGKAFADAYARYVPVRASAMRAVTATKGLRDLSNFLAGADAAATPASNQYDKAVVLAGKIADVARTLLQDQVVIPLETRLQKLRESRDTLRGKLTDVPAGMFSSLSDTSGVTVIDGDVVAAEAGIQGMKDDLAAGRFVEVRMASQRPVPRGMGLAERTAERRLKYDAQRRATLDRMGTLADGAKKIEGKKGMDPMVGRLMSMQALVRRADRLASREGMRMEDGIAELLAIEATVKQLVDVNNDAVAYLNERAPADERFARLEKLPAAAYLGDAIAGIRRQLDAAAKATGIVNAKASIATGEGMEDHFAGGQNWNAALAEVRQAVAEMAAAEALAGKVGDAAGLFEQAGKADDPSQVTAAVDDLRRRAVEARKQPHAALAAEEFRHVDESLALASEEAGDGRIELARVPLQGAAGKLIEAQTVQSEHQRYLDARQPLDAQLEGLSTSTEPPAAKIKAVTEPVKLALDKAKQADEARKWPQAHAALREAADAAKHAELVQRLRREFDAAHKDIENQRVALSDPLKQQIGEVLAKATAAADDLNLDHANRFLDNAKARLAGERVKALIDTPDDPDFMAAVEQMLAAKGGQELLARATDNPTQLRNKDKIRDQQGKEITYGKQVQSGPELLDEIVKSLPEDTDPNVIARLFKKRFGTDLLVSAIHVETGGDGTRTVTDKVPIAASYSEGRAAKPHTQRTKSSLKLYEMMAAVPEQSVDNPSLKTVERRSALKNIQLISGALNYDIESGGFYKAQDADNKGLAVVKGRPGDGTQEFGDNLRKGPDPELPKSEPGFEAANDDPVDYFAFAALHEIGHAVDDRVRFMATKGSQPEYGGWIAHGADLGPIVDAVAQHTGYDSTAEQKQYIRDLMTHTDPVPPKAPDREAAVWEQARLKVVAWAAIATGKTLWKKQNLCNQVTIDGRIYQEAYDGSWNSYLAAARGKGVTGYQFRAPGEWFAELYACYHCGKLKKGHPARAWLSSLSL